MHPWRRCPPSRERRSRFQLAEAVRDRLLWLSVAAAAFLRAPVFIAARFATRSFRRAYAARTSAAGTPMSRPALSKPVLQRILLPIALVASLALTGTAMAGPEQDQRALNAVRVLAEVQRIPESAIPDRLF